MLDQAILTDCVPARFDPSMFPAKKDLFVAGSCANAISGIQVAFWGAHFTPQPQDYHRLLAHSVADYLFAQSRCGAALHGSWIGRFIKSSLHRGPS